MNQTNKKIEITPNKINFPILFGKYHLNYMRPRKILGKLDLFKRPLFLRVVNQEMVSTNCDLCFFLSFLIYFCLGGFLSQSDFFLKTNPKIITETSQFSEAPPINLNNK